ncbi:FCD domain-containing protein [Streptomyces sp. SID4919]|uniref:FadR/GntR family transcriptional regulator n=1 Tax=unclassified Streptomyces TaxID=2593676 RepID=UPI000823E934|nr:MULTISPECIES: FCD domain-containing protein [unclassified Streptomyces]MYY07863.1 FCD domain-containing protein [Streptomyces sp. SID4919]SCK06455.1 transcriptional regulator, GntR family [Streptomyces sp. AmelKG-E11A]
MDPKRFAPVSRATVPEQIRDSLLDGIRDGSLAPGSRLPAERTLCEQFGVARTSVREAVQGLVVLGCVTKRGNRFVVADSLPDMPLGGEDRRKRNISELFEVRQVMEVAIARLAATRADPAERARITALAAEFGPGMRLEDFRDLDRRFHLALARACGNPTLHELYRKALDAVFASADFSSLLDAEDNAGAVREVIAEACLAHVRIAAGVAGGDPHTAALAAADHLGEVEKHMIARMF